ncbi:MAG TPA: uridine diphosphate-N-acetylglucosamine-binding protein YvcK [Candidatus Polarisedimenticolia bacterium]|nr:uridine diphosphate-N-acetylglucosamine-binding protein YvcK [Candidatus Polarisedimenticolia bacterium]
MIPARGRRLRVVSLGGGTGMATVLSGLKRYVGAPRGKVSLQSLTAVVAVTDDGGSSGRLRDEFQILPPGDIRNCIVALSDDTALLSRLFQFRFNGNGHLGGHSLGNLLLTALTSVKGDFLQAIRAASDVLAIKGTIYPATMENVHLVADLADGRRVRGESRIARAGVPISAVRLEPSDCRPLPETLAAIRAADVITVGPGSLFTSIVPTLLVPGVAAAMRSSRAVKVFVCNVMTQPGETPGFTASDHVRRVRELCGPGLLDVALVNSEVPSAASRRRYRRDGAEPVAADAARFRGLGVTVCLRKVLAEDSVVRHHPDKLARHILALRFARAGRRKDRRSALGRRAG